MPESGLMELFMDELRDIYYAENQILKALPKMAKVAQSDDLRQAFQNHEEQTRGHVQRLEKVFEMHNMPARGKKCMGIEGIISEGDEMMTKEGLHGPTLDAALITSAQKVEHYEMATYGSLRTWARELGDDQAAKLLQQTLDEEGDTDHKLTALAEKMINLQAEKQMMGQGKAKK